MPTADHRLEVRSQMLASEISHRRQTLRDAIAPAGQRPPFTQQMSRPEALAFWQAHRYDEYGQAALARMKPEDVQALDLALSQANQAAMFAAPVGGNEYGA